MLVIAHEIPASFTYVRRTLLTLILTYGNKKSTLVTFKVEGLVISLFYGKGVELLVDGDIMFQYCKFGNFPVGCIFAKLRNEDILPIERICASSGQ